MRSVFVTFYLFITPALAVPTVSAFDITARVDIQHAARGIALQIRWYSEDQAHLSFRRTYVKTYSAL